MADSASASESKLARLFDSKSVRIGMALAIGVPASAFVVVFGLLGIVMGIGNIMNAVEVAHSAGLVATILLGMLGTCGAWVRIFHRSADLTTRAAAAVRALLACGIGSAGVIAGYAALRVGDGRIAAAFLLLGGLGAALRMATPQRPGKPDNRRPLGNGAS